jgi:acetyl esterase/lipase
MAPPWGMPPVYLSMARFDPLRDEGEELAERLRAGVPVVARRYLHRDEVDQRRHFDGRRVRRE